MDTKDRGQSRAARSGRLGFALGTTGTSARRPGGELTYTCVPPGSGVRIGLDRDEDGFLDGDELVAGSDPADPASTPRVR